MRLAAILPYSAPRSETERLANVVNAEIKKHRKNISTTIKFVKLPVFFSDPGGLQRHPVPVSPDLCLIVQNPTDSIQFTATELMGKITVTMSLYDGPYD